MKIEAFFTRISGRQQKRGKFESAPTILAGLSTLLNSLQLLSEYSPDELNAIAKTTFDLYKMVDTYNLRGLPISDSFYSEYQARHIS